jgi:hypothetical protein
VHHVDLLLERELPEQLQAPADSGPIAAAPSYSGSHDALEVVIAPPSFTGRWGLYRELNDGERIEAVGYIGRSHDDEFRPVVFWVEDGKPVNQVLNNELPARPLSAPYPEGDVSSAAADSGPSPAVVWGTLGVAVTAVLAGGAMFLRARSRRA